MLERDRYKPAEPGGVGKGGENKMEYPWRPSIVGGDGPMGKRSRVEATPLAAPSPALQTRRTVPRLVGPAASLFAESQGQKTNSTSVSAR